MKLSVHLVTWNGAKYIPYLFESLRRQTYKDWELLILDNASSDDTLQKIKIEIENFPVKTEIIESEKNTGFAGGHNRLISDFRFQISDYILLLNQDMYLQKECLQRLVEFMDTHEEAGAVTPMLLKWEFGKIVGGFEASMTDMIDSIGLDVTRNRRVRELMSGYSIRDAAKRLKGNSIEVFGVSGALPLYRRRALEDAAFSDGSVFDESYHAYKEDVDLAFRLQAAGWASRAFLPAIAFHDRGGAGPRDLDDASAAENKQKQSEWVRYHSYKNHLMTLYKNEYWQNVLLDFPWIFWYELKKFMWFLFYDRPVLKGLGEIGKSRKDLKIKRLKMKEMRKINWREMRKWWK